MGWENSSSQLIRYFGLDLSILIIKSRLISEILFTCLGNSMFCRRMTPLSSTTLRALNGGLDIPIITFHRASSNNKLPRSKCQPCCYIIGSEAPQEPCSMEIQALLPLVTPIQAFLRNQNPQFSQLHHSSIYWPAWGLGEGFYAYIDAQIHG